MEGADMPVLLYPVPARYEVTGVEIPNRVFLGGLPYDATEYDLFEFFKQYGKVKDAKIIVDKNSGKPKGYGFITFETSEEADQVRDKGSLFYHHKKINVSRAVRKQGGQFVGSKINQEYMNGLCQSFSGMNMTPPDPMSCTQPTKPVLSLMPPQIACPPQVPEMNPHFHLHPPMIAPPPYPSSPGYAPVLRYTHFPSKAPPPPASFNNPV
jgi:hypothetical protein